MDVEHYATRDRNLIIPLVLLVVLIILALLLRAVVAPLVLIGTVVLSFAAIIVRSVLVTALNLDLGDRIWWPGRLSRPAGQVTGAPGTPVTAGRR